MGKTIMFLVAVFMSSCLMSCDLETSDNGKLDGFWHLERIDTLATGRALDMSGEKVFWSFQVNLLQLQEAPRLSIFVSTKMPTVCRYTLHTRPMAMRRPWVRGATSL